VIQEKAFIAEKNALHTPKLQLVVLTIGISLEIEPGYGILAAFLSQIETN
jgi:hypothetical protein